MTVPGETDSTRRFSSRAIYYGAYRPRYPDSVLDFLRRDAGLAAHAAIADIGSGTGLSADLFLRHGYTVYGVEPNAEMRREAETRLAHFPAFHSVTGTAEDTTLPAACAEWIVCASAFHWFDPARARVEFERILKPGGTVLLMGNIHRRSGSEFMAAYDRIFRKYSVRIPAHENREERMRAFFAPQSFQTAWVAYRESLDWRQLSGRLLSYSSIPLPEQPGYDAMMSEAREAFEAAAQDGQVTFEGEVNLSWGALN